MLTHNITMVAGDTRTITVELRVGDAQQPLVTGDTVYFTVKEKACLDAKVLQKTVTAFTVDGLAVINIDPADTASLETKAYVYDIQITLADGKTYTVVDPKSTFTLLEGVTNE